MHKSKFVSLAPRLLLVPFTAMFVAGLFSTLGRGLDEIVFRLTETEYCYARLRPEALAGGVTFAVLGWALALAALEIYETFAAVFPFPRLLVNLRFGPYLIFLFALVVTFAYDRARIALARSELRAYVYAADARVAPPAVELYNDYRGPCGNGAWERPAELYFATAAEGFADARPAVRARALLAAARMPTDARFAALLKSGCNDPDALVGAAAEGILGRSGSSCARFLSSR